MAAIMIENPTPVATPAIDGKAAGGLRTGLPALDAVLARLASGWLRPAALVVVERSKRSPEPTWPEGLERDGKPRKYGETTIWLARPAT